MLFLEISEDLPTISLFLEEDEEIVDSLFTIGLGDHSNLEYDLGILLNELSISEENKNVLKNIIYSYRGEMDEYLKLASYSSVINS